MLNFFNFTQTFKKNFNEKLANHQKFLTMSNYLTNNGSS